MKDVIEPNNHKKLIQKYGKNAILADFERVKIDLDDIFARIKSLELATKQSTSKMTKHFTDLKREFNKFKKKKL
jgi:hypothetical protein